MHKRIANFIFFSFLAIPFCLQAAPACSEWLATAVSIQGQVDTQYSNTRHWNPIIMGHRFCYGDKVRTSKHSRATLIFKNGPRITLTQNSTLSFAKTTQKQTSWIINLLNGSGFIRSRQSHRLNVQTPFINAVHEGTEFLVTVNSKQTEITVFDGQVAGTNPMGEIHIKKGYTGVAVNQQAPYVRPILIRPEDAVQWSLYYPPIIDINTYTQRVFQPSLQAYKQGNIAEALKQLEKIEISSHDISYLSLKSALLLMLGSVDQAIKTINQSLLVSPNNTSAYALQAIIAVTKNRHDKAFNLATKAITLNPKSTTALIALSYVHQAKFNITDALKTTKKAVQLSPNNALAWARLAELQLSTGDHKEALKSAKQAQILNPKLGRTQTILGFNYLAQIDIENAKAAFTQAITLDSADPLAHLGLGLAKIRKGKVEEGTHDIETAVSLDPDNAIMRSYLGKAYYELRNDNYAATELAIAKEIDPNDPTPWFYNAIRQQTTNQPVNALHEMQKAIELNDNRGVYRSKLLLDQDAAARSANMARIYQDLNFDRVALKQAWTSLGQDYTNPSAHRFLSDTLQGKPRHRIARASELLQAQLFQPINTVPVQPQLTSENIGILNSTGPGSLSSNEYDPLFTSNGAHLLFNGAVGSNNTLTDSAIVSGVYDQFSVSFGQFHYQTDGFRVNDDYKQNIYNVFAQAAITKDLNIQVEFKREDVTAGDVPLNSNGFHQENLRKSINQDTARFGLNYKISPTQDLVFSAFLNEIDEINTNNRKFPTVTSPLLLPSSSLETTKTEHSTSVIEESGYQLEGQYLFHPKSFDLIAGFGFLHLNASDNVITRTDTLNEVFAPLFPFFERSDFTVGIPINKPTHHETNFYNGYIYSHLKISKNLTSILGLSYDLYNDGLINKSQLNPKTGLIWNPFQELTIRGAIFRTLKRPLAASQTIEPTQIAGFNQLFDSNNGTIAWNYGLGFDFHPFKPLYLGGEVTWRNTNQPIISGDNTNYQDRNESSHLAYLHLIPAKWIALSSQYKYDEFHRDYIVNDESPNNPRKIASHQLPISLNFYHSTGLFSTFTGNFINQKVEYINSQNSLDAKNESFWLFNTLFGFRLPKKNWLYKS